MSLGLTDLHARIGLTSTLWRASSFKEKSNFHRYAKDQTGRTKRHRLPANLRGEACRAFASPADSAVLDKRNSLLRFVQEVQAQDVLEDFQQIAPPAVVDAMRTTVTNLLGTLPPSYFHTQTSASVEDMAQMMYSIMMTGYMYRNGQYRMELDHMRSVDGDAERVERRLERQGQRLGSRETGVYAAGTQLARVQGDILHWRKDTQEVEVVPADSYIRHCEEEIEDLREQVARLMYARGSGNELLDFIKVQDPQQLKELTESASSPVFEAMNSFVHRLIGSDGRKVEVNNQELARIFYFLLVVGYNIRQLEVKFDFESSFTVPSTKRL